MVDKIELLSTKLLDQHRQLVTAFERLSLRVGHGLGWHYLLDLTWAGNELAAFLPPGANILDAGAGIGLMQWYLAEQGYQVISVDARPRNDLTPYMRTHYKISGWLPGHFTLSRPRLVEFLPPRRLDQLYRWPGKLSLAFHMLWPRPTFPGQVYLYNQDLKNLVDIPEASVDAVVSISALEHNDPQDLNRIVHELARKIRPGGKLIATLGAARDQDWYHKPSRGWCYTEQSLRKLCELSEDCPSNYDSYDMIFTGLRNSVELEEKLSNFYRKPGNHGMPSGRWDPEYAVVGIVKEIP